MQRKKIIIIGGGVAGMSAGIYSRLNGFDAEILEMHTRPGGQCTAWDRKGYRFDYCLHWLVGSSKGVFHDVWKATNVLNDDVKVFNHEVFGRLEDEEGSEFFVYADIDRWREYLIKMAPEDTRAIRKMCNHMKRGAGFDSIASPPGLRGPLDLIKVMPGMFPVMLLMARFGKMSALEYLDWLGFKNAQLRYFMEKLFGQANLSALAVILMLSWFHSGNAGYLIGGSLPMARRMASRFESLGGKFRFRSRVTSIIVENDIARGVILDDGTRLEADYVVSASDGHNTLYNMLEGKYLAKKTREAYETWELFTPLVQVSLGIKEKVETSSNATTYIYNGSIGSTKIEKGISLMNQSAFDPTMAPEGKSTMIIRFESPWEIWESLEGDDYKNEKNRVEIEILSLLEVKFPGITSKIEVIDIATPKTGVKYTGVWKGAYEGFAPSGDITRSLDMELPGLSNFYMAGQWLAPGGGLPPSAQSGNWVLQKICRKEKIRFNDGVSGNR